MRPIRLRVRLPPSHIDPNRHPLWSVRVGCNLESLIRQAPCLLEIYSPLGGWPGQIPGFLLRESTSHTVTRENSRVGQAGVLTFVVKLRVATELIRTAAPVRPVVGEQVVEKIGPQPGNTPLTRRE